MWGLIVALGAVANFARGAATDAPLTVPAWAEDAEMLSITFIDHQRGWAAGQHGVIWHTADGGDTWQLQYHQQGCRLQSVCFVDERHGWAVGSRARPLPSSLEGVVLRTNDGGRTWRSEQRLLLPALLDVRFFDAQRGIACGWPSALHPTSIVVTRDGGQAWTSLPWDTQAICTAAHFTGEQAGLLAQSDGRVRGFQGSKSLVTDKVADRLRSIRALTLTAEGAGVAAGDGGLLLRSANGGETWQPVDFGQKTSTYDWRTVAVHGQRVWVAGDPGNVVFASDDEGETWTALHTGQTLPIRALTFIDGQVGFACCALGTILRTADGGHTWQVARAGADRTGWLAVYSDPQAMPLELAAKLSAAAGYRGTAQFVARRDCVAWPGLERELPLRAAHALDALGVNSARIAWGYPARERGIRGSREQLLSVWDRLHDGQAQQRLRDEIEQAIRTMRPDVVFTHSGQSDDPLGQLVSRLVVEAVEAAARQPNDPDTTVATAWQVKRVLGSRWGAQRSALSLVLAEVSTSLGCTLEQYVDVPTRYLPFAVNRTESMVAFDVLAGAAGENSSTSLLAAMQAAPGSVTRRATMESHEQTVEGVHRAAQYGRNLKAIVEMSNHPSITPSQLLSRIDTLLQDIDVDEAASLLGSLGQQYYHTGNLRMACEAWQMLATRYPEHPLSASVLSRLLIVRASGEVAHRFRNTDALLGSTDQSLAFAPVQAVAFSGAVGPNDLNVQSAVSPESPSQRHSDQATQLLKAVASTATRLEQADAALYAEPRGRYALAAFQRRQIGHEAGRRHFSVISSLRGAPAWRANAAAELWLTDPHGPCPKQIVRCPRIAEKPYLDGELNDAAWQSIEGLALRSPYHDDERWQSSIYVAHDGEYLYLAGQCATDGEPVVATAAQRQRDGDLSGYDRFEMYLDIDRDYSSYYTLKVDERGHTLDACVDDTTWNPRWYVAHAASTTGWSFEAAIPLAELVAEPPTAETTWAIGLQRVIPARGYQSATVPASPSCQPEGFGLFRFE